MQKSMIQAVALVILGALAVSPAGKAEQPPFERVDGIILPAGESALRSAAIDAVGNFALFGTYSLDGPSRIVLIDLRTFERAASIEVPAVNGFVAATMDPAGIFSYFLGSNGVVVKVRRRFFPTIGFILSYSTLSTGTGSFQGGAAVMDPAGNFAYFATTQEPSKVIKVNLGDFTSFQVLTLNSGDDDVRAATIDPSGVFGYFGTRVVSGGARVVKVHLPTLQRVAMVQVDTHVSSMEMAPDGNLAYAVHPGTGVTRLHLTNFTAGTRLSGTAFGQIGGRSSLIDPEGRYLYLGTSGRRIQRIDLDAFQLVNEITLPTGEENFPSAVMSPDGLFAYFGTDRGVETGGNQPGQVIKVRIGQLPDGIFADRFQ